MKIEDIEKVIEESREKALAEGFIQKKYFNYIATAIHLAQKKEQEEKEKEREETIQVLMLEVSVKQSRIEMLEGQLTEGKK